MCKSLLLQFNSLLKWGIYLAKAAYPLPVLALSIAKRTATFLTPAPSCISKLIKDKKYCGINLQNTRKKRILWLQLLLWYVVPDCICDVHFSPHPSSLGSFSLFFSLALFSPFFPPPLPFCFCCLSWRFSTTDSVSPVNTTVVLPNPATRPSTHTKYYHLFILFPF